MMKRRSFFRTAGTASLLPFFSFCNDFTKVQPTQKRKPNIIFILADDMGYGDLGCQNSQSLIPTPNLDRLAAQGIRFTDAHTASAVCSPSRYSILTGRYCWRTRLKKWVLWEWDPPLIDEARMTVGDMLKKEGYHTACIGKWHLGWNWPTNDGNSAKDGKGWNVDFKRPITGGPIDHGFDYYFGDDVPNFPPYCFIENDRTLGLPTDAKPDSMFGHPGPMLPGWKLQDVMTTITDKAVAYIEEQARDKAENPFFLFLPLTAPHTPIAPADEFIGKSGAGRYGDYVCQVDHTAGQVMDALKRMGISENTLIIFTSDNGSPCRDGSNMNGEVNSVKRFGHDPNTPWRGIKADAWDGGHRVPFLASWPGMIKAGSVSNELICQADFMATIAALQEITLPDNAGEDSMNILPALLGHDYDSPIHEAVIHHSGAGLFCVRSGKWKMIDGLGAGGFSGGIEQPSPGKPHGQLYNLENDPQEQHNLYETHPEIVSTLSEILRRYKESGRSRPIEQT